MILNTTAWNRFWPKVEKGPNCWNWIAGTDVHGYGRFSTGWRSGSTVPAQRVSWALTVGDPGQFHVLHKCDNPLCVRPDHLFLGNQLINMRDMVSKGRHGCAIKTHCPKGHAYSGDNLYRSRNGRFCKECNREAARKYYRSKL